MPDFATERVMIPGLVREAGDLVEVGFYESPRIYRLMLTGSELATAVRLLRAAADMGARVRVTLDDPHGDAIIDVIAVPEP